MPMDAPILIYVGAAAVIAAIGLIMWAFLSQPATAGARDLSGITDMREAVLRESAGDRLLTPLLRSLGRRTRRLTPAGMTDELENRLRYAGIAQKWPIERILAAKALLAIVGLALGFAYWSNNGGGMGLIVMIGLGFGFYMAPDYQLKSLATTRSREIDYQLPDVLDQMTVSVEAGLGFDAALARVVKEDDGPLIEELGRAMQDVQLGVRRSDALGAILNRTDSTDLRHFLLALTQAERLGMPLARVLRIQAKEMRHKRRMRAEEAAMKTPVKLVFPLIMCILPSLFVVIMGPAAIRIMESGVFG